MKFPVSKQRRFTLSILAALLCLAAPMVLATAPTLGWKLLTTNSHQSEDFTQGLVWVDGRLFESTGQYGASKIQEKELKTGKLLRQTPLTNREFAEGLAAHKGELWQLTWREGVAHVYDYALNPLRSIQYRGEGWGLTSNGEHLIVSNGSAKLFFLDTNNLAVTRSIDVTDAGRPIFRLNELEWIDGAIYANVWHSNRVARIDAQTGSVTGWLDFTDLAKQVGPLDAESVLNGLAWDANARQLLVTGKRWPKLFTVQLAP